MNVIPLAAFLNLDWVCLCALVAYLWMGKMDLLIETCESL